MYLGIRTDSPEAILYLYEETECVSTKSWQADRSLAKDLLSQIEIFLTDNNQEFKTLNGLFVYLGPGSFTGLRIGITVMNTLAYSLSIPIIGLTGESWVSDSLKSLIGGRDDKCIRPYYGSEPRITSPIK